MGKWPYFAALIYIDLLPTEKPLKLLPDVVAEYIVGARPLASPPRGFDVNVQWDLSGRDILQIVDLLLRLLTILGVGG
jgi:hypothetical protein